MHCFFLENIAIFIFSLIKPSMRITVLFLIVCCLSCFQFTVSGQNIFINEIMSANSSTVADDDGDYSDWIELYNAGSEAVQMEGWSLSDSYEEPAKWVFPKYIFNPGEYLLVWASGKDRKPVAGEMINGLMREVYSNISGSAIQDLLQHSRYPEDPDSRQVMSGSFEAPVNVDDNYGQRIHGLIKAPVSGNYIFWISSDDNGQLLLSTNDKMENLKVIAEVPGWTNNREWEKYPEQKSGSIYLSKDKFYYIMALMKEGGGGDHLSVQWQLPNGSKESPVSAANLFWTGAAPFHSNFSISAEGEPIILKNNTGVTVDEILPIVLPIDVSYGRSPDGSTSFYYFSKSTPGETNSPNGYTELLKPPVFSHPGGFYSTSFELSLTAEPGTTIIYSTDGTDPTPASRAGVTYYYKNQYSQYPGSVSGPYLGNTFRSNSYSTPLRIVNKSADENVISAISTTYDFNPFYIPAEPIEKAIVVKARAYKDGGLPSEVVTHTFFVNETGQNPYTLPVISLSAQQDALFSYEKGINVAGQDFESWRNSNPDAAANGGSKANYHRKGDTWEYPGSIELFEQGGRRFLGQNIGFRIHGGWSRSAALKSLRIYSRKTYGDSYLDYSFFKDQEFSAYKRIILRNSGNDYWYTYFRDAAIQEMVKHMNVETMDYQPSVIFLNGEYWGILNIRERFDKHYLARKFSIDENQVDILEGNMWPREGDNKHYVETMNYINQFGLQDSNSYDYIKTRISTESYIDYLIAELFSSNTDWPGNNIKFWRLKTDDYIPDAGPGKDGRWRWMLFDTDFGFGIYNPNDYEKNMLEFASEDSGPGWPNPPWSTLLFRKLLESEVFRTEFITRYCDQLNTALLPEVVKSVINTKKQLLEPEIEGHLKRWRASSDTSNWNRTIRVMLNYADKRPEFVRTHLREFFELESDYSVTVNISDPGHGYVVLNTLPLKKETKGINENTYPWSGTYFKKLPLRLEAIPEKGYDFIRWETGGSSHYETVLEVYPESDQQFTAVFEKAPKDDELVHYWNFNNTGNLLTPTYTLITASIQPAVPSGGTSEITFDTGQGFTAENARFGDEAGSHLRLNNPLGATLTFSLPTTGFSRIKFAYETRRSGQGAGKQIIEYSVNGTDFIPFRELTIEDADPVLIYLDFSAIEGANDNPDFKIRISYAQGNGGLEGNNRFDNITLEGMPADDVNLPPSVLQIPDDLFLIEGEEFSILFNELFSDPNGDPLEFNVTSNRPDVANSSDTSTEMIMSALQRGECMFEITASDGINPSVKLQFRVMVYPEAFRLAENNFTFSNWNPNAPEMTFPDNMLFLQSDKNDPMVADPLDFAYHIPDDEYADDDAANYGFPYRNSRRTRLNGLGEDGIAFINTGRGRDLGGALVALNTSGLDEIQAQWLAGTLLQNERNYGLILQYRTGTTGNFTDLPFTEYQSASDGDTQEKGPVLLPPQLLNQEYVQLLWRYHFLSGTTGPRAQLRLDDILIAASPSVPVVTHPTSATPVTEDFIVQWSPANRAQKYELQIADNEDFTNPLLSLNNITETSYLQQALEGNAYYYLRVRAINEMTVSGWSETVTLYSPATGAGISELQSDRIFIYPNPFNETTRLQLNLVKSGKADVSLFDLSGRKLMTVFQGHLIAGESSYTIAGSNLPAGTYVIICQTESGTIRQKLVKH
jgi:hypothetical protein